MILIRWLLLLKKRHGNNYKFYVNVINSQIVNYHYFLYGFILLIVILCLYVAYIIFGKNTTGTRIVYKTQDKPVL